MAVFDELNRGEHRFEDPEIRQAEKIKRKGEGESLKQKSSGVTFKTYRASLAIAYTLIAAAAIVGIGYLSYFAIMAFVGA